MSRSRTARSVRGDRNPTAGEHPTGGGTTPVGRRRPRRARRIALIALAALVGAPVLATAGLLAWDGGIDTGPTRELLPDVRIDLRTAQTALGPIEYDLSGDDGPVVLSVHAGLGGADQGRLFADWLGGAGFRILSPSRPGYLGTPLDSGRTAEEQADLLVALLDQLGIDRVAVLAVSVGAPVGYALAARHPERVWGLVPVGGVSRPRPAAAEPSAVRRVFLNTVGQQLARLTAVASPRSIVTATLDETSTFSEEQKAARTAHMMDTPAVRALFTAIFDCTFPYSQRMPGTDNDAAMARLAPPLDRITVPTLVVHGSQDGDVAFADGIEAAERIPGAEHLWLDAEDHLGFWLSPDAAAAQSTVREFLLRHASGGGR